MSINYYVIASTSMPWDVRDERGSSIDNKNVTESSRFDISSQESQVCIASIKIGSTYDWAKPTTATDTIRTFNVTSTTTPITNFQASYQSDAGKSSAGFDIQNSMYFLTTGFPNWDGYGVYNDPEVSLLASKGVEYTEPQPPPQNPPTSNPTNNAGTNEPSTEPVTEPPSQPPTEPPTQPPTTPPTTPPNQPGATGGSDVPWAVIGVGVAAALAVVSFVIVRVKRKK
jgi:hypothetical protein